MNSKSQKGQGFVEFALILLPFFLIIWGVVDLSPVYPLATSLQGAANFGARAAIVWNPATSPKTCDETVLDAVNSRSGYISSVAISSICSGWTPIPRGAYVTVTLQATYQPPFYGTIFNPPVPRTFVIQRFSKMQKW